MYNSIAQQDAHHVERQHEYLRTCITRMRVVILAQLPEQHAPHQGGVPQARGERGGFGREPQSRCLLDDTLLIQLRGEDGSTSHCGRLLTGVMRRSRRSSCRWLGPAAGRTTGVGEDSTDANGRVGSTESDCMVSCGSVSNTSNSGMFYKYLRTTVSFPPYPSGTQTIGKMRWGPWRRIDCVPLAWTEGVKARLGTPRHNPPARGALTDHGLPAEANLIQNESGRR